MKARLCPGTRRRLRCAGKRRRQRCEVCVAPTGIYLPCKLRISPSDIFGPCDPDSPQHPPTALAEAVVAGLVTINPLDPFDAQYTYIGPTFEPFAGFPWHHEVRVYTSFDLGSCKLAARIEIDAVADGSGIAREEFRGTVLIALPSSPGTVAGTADNSNPPCDDPDNPAYTGGTASVQVDLQAEPCVPPAYAKVRACLICNADGSYSLGPATVIETSNSDPGGLDVDGLGTWAPESEDEGCVANCCFTAWVATGGKYTESDWVWTGPVPTFSVGSGDDDTITEAEARQCCKECCKTGYGPDGTPDTPGAGCCVADGDEYVLLPSLEVSNATPPDGDFVQGIYTGAQFADLMAALNGTEWRYRHTCPTAEGVSPWTRISPSTLPQWTPSAIPPTPQDIEVKPSDDGGLTSGYEFLPAYALYTCPGTGESGTGDRNLPGAPVSGDGRIFIAVDGVTKEVVPTMRWVLSRSCDCVEDGEGGCRKRGAAGYKITTRITCPTGELTDPVVTDGVDLSGCPPLDTWLEDPEDPCVRVKFFRGCAPTEAPSFGESFPAPTLSPEEIVACCG